MYTLFDIFLDIFLQVPLIKMTDRASGVNVDISFNTNNGIKSVELINSFKSIKLLTVLFLYVSSRFNMALFLFLGKYPALPRLVMVIKQFVSQRNFNETSAGGVSSYSLVLMVVSFFQVFIEF